jgi:1,4-dihydroxy-2-naphthoyl-CoA hydrolase
MEPVPDVVGGFARLIGLEFDEATGDRVALRCTVRPDLLQPYGILHGGVHCAIVETAASVGAAMWLGDKGHVVGVSNQTDFLRAVRDGELRATALPLHRGRSQQLWTVEIRDNGERLMARGQVRLQNVPSAAALGRP